MESKRIKVLVIELIKATVRITHFLNTGSRETELRMHEEGLNDFKDSHFVCS
jgi:hypothetical protein